MPSPPPSSKAGSPRPARIPSPESKLEAAYARLLRAHKIPPPIREYRFHPERKWRFDFAWPEQKVAVELEGGIWRRSGKGAHTGGAAVTRDAEKSNEAQLQGWLVLRFIDAHLEDGTAIEWTRRALGLPEGSGARAP